MGAARTIIAIWAGKATWLALKLLHRTGSHYPGHVALLVCPNLIRTIRKPSRVVVVTGTNGKTTVTNLVVDALAGEGVATVNNRAGSNTDAGIASALVGGVTWTGRPKAETAVLEMDERSARRILPGLAPDIMVCTNLTRDSIKRNAHAEYIMWILDSAISVDTRLVLNGDDLIAARLGDESQRVLFGVAPLPGEAPRSPRGVARDLAICPICDTMLDWDLWRFNHIGRAHCPACGFASPDLAYTVTSVDADPADESVGKRITIDTGGATLTCKLLNDNIVNIYNQVAVVAALDLLGVPLDHIRAAFDHLSAPETRYHAQTVGQTNLVRQLTKGLVGVACSRAFEYIMAQPGSKAIVMNIDEVTDAKNDCENTCWIYDADYEFLADPSVRQIVVGGRRRYDQALRLAIARVDPAIIETVPDELETADLVSLEGIDNVYNLHSVHNAISTGDVVETRLATRLGVAAPVDSAAQVDPAAPVDSEQTR